MNTAASHFDIDPYFLWHNLPNMCNREVYILYERPYSPSAHSLRVNTCRGWETLCILSSFVPSPICESLEATPSLLFPLLTVPRRALGHRTWGPSHISTGHQPISPPFHPQRHLQLMFIHLLIYDEDMLLNIFDTFPWGSWVFRFRHSMVVVLGQKMGIERDLVWVPIGWRSCGSIFLAL